MRRLMTIALAALLSASVCGCGDEDTELEGNGLENGIETNGAELPEGVEEEPATELPE